MASDVDEKLGVADRFAWSGRKRGLSVDLRTTIFCSWCQVLLATQTENPGVADRCQVVPPVNNSDNKIKHL